MTTQHTQGPWEAEEHGVIRGRHGMIRPFICQVQDDHNDEETQANARLIASAPDLLSTLNQLVDCMTENEDGEKLYADWLTISHAAIAKATGGEE